MDTSEKYIKMCEKAEEIQNLRKGRSRSFKGWKIGDFYDFKGSIDVFHFCDEAFYLPPKGSIWLPRQDQLQGMVEGIQNNVHRIFRFCNFIKKSYLPITHQTPYIYFYNLTDREDIEAMLWLAFVMHKKYQKQWSEEKSTWIR